MCECPDDGDVAFGVRFHANIGSLTVPPCHRGRRRRDVYRPRAAAGPVKIPREYRAERPCHPDGQRHAVGHRQGSVRPPKLEHTNRGTFSAPGIGSWEDGDTTGVLQLDDAPKVKPLQVYEDRDVEGIEANVNPG